MEQHDPHIKQYIKDMLYAFLYNPVEHHFKRQLNSIIIKNSSLMNTAYQLFSYKGIRYELQTGLLPPRKISRLSPILQSVMDEYLYEVEHLHNTELPYVLGFINQVLNSSNNLNDYLKMFPECIHGPISKLIGSYPNPYLEDMDTDIIKKLIENNQIPIDMIKGRMVSNLLI